MQKFTLASLQTPSGPKAAIGVGESYYLIETQQPLLQSETVKTLLTDWAAAFPVLEEMAAAIAADLKKAENGIPAASADLLTPQLYPNSLMAVGANYSGHLKEMGLNPQKWASMPFFLRPPIHTLVGPGETVSIPKSTKQFDWECELTVVVGKTLRNATKEEAMDAIAGYAIGLDLSCRDLIQVDNDLKVDLVRGKAQDTMAPCGPFIVPKQFMPDINDLRIQLFVNDEKMMDASTSEMLYKVDEQLSVISEYLTIDAGDMLFTGSPSGSAAEHGGCWLKPGDRIHATIDGIGALDVSMRHDP